MCWWPLLGMGRSHQTQGGSCSPKGGGSPLFLTSGSLFAVVLRDGRQGWKLPECGRLSGEEGEGLVAAGVPVLSDWGKETGFSRTRLEQACVPDFFLALAKGTVGILAALPTCLEWEKRLRSAAGSPC